MADNPEKYPLLGAERLPWTSADVKRLRSITVEQALGLLSRNDAAVEAKGFSAGEASMRERAGGVTGNANPMKQLTRSAYGIGYHKAREDIEQAIRALKGANEFDLTEESAAEKVITPDSQ